jgi:hypothetical protein
MSTLRHGSAPILKREEITMKTFLIAAALTALLAIPAGADDSLSRRAGNIR